MLEAKLPQETWVAGPIFLNLHPKFEKHVLVKKDLNVSSGGLAQLFEFAAVLADDDAFLRILFHINGSVDRDQLLARVFLEALDRHRG